MPSMHEELRLRDWQSNHERTLSNNQRKTLAHLLDHELVEVVELVGTPSDRGSFHRGTVCTSILRLSKFFPCIFHSAHSASLLRAG
eukprot:SAG31_NODE_10017_length_1195_cov_1.315693_2_plen_85_part_01